MARTRKFLPQHLDIAHLMSTGVLARACLRELIDEVLAEPGAAGAWYRSATV